MKFPTQTPIFLRDLFAIGFWVLTQVTSERTAYIYVLFSFIQCLSLLVNSNSWGVWILQIHKESTKTYCTKQSSCIPDSLSVKCISENLYH